MTATVPIIDSSRGLRGSAPDPTSLDGFGYDWTAAEPPC